MSHGHPDAKQIIAQWWASLAEFRTDIAAAKGNEALIEKACNAEEARSDYLLAAVEGVTSMTPQEAAELLDLTLVLFAREDREDDQIFRLLSTIREGLAPKN
jgi:hypothetical protein